MAAKKKRTAKSTHPIRKLSASDNHLVERVRKICMKLPEANERISHGEPTWFAGKGKVFAMIDGHHHNSPHLSVWLPQPLGAAAGIERAAEPRFASPGAARRQSLSPDTPHRPPRRARPGRARERSRSG